LGIYQLLGGMGLLGLLNLIYFAENYTEKARSLIVANREYPWAVTGINITSMLLNMLNLTAGMTINVDCQF
jgi:hypothetical protein